MKAIEKLRRSGLSTKQIADGSRCGEHTIRLYERHLRFPGRKTFLCMVELAESRGLTLLARDFLRPASEEKCEPNGAGG